MPLLCVAVGKFLLSYLPLESFHISLYAPGKYLMAWLAMQHRTDPTKDYTKTALPSVGRDLLLMESIDDSFTALLGQGAKNALYAYLVKRRALDREDIPERLDDFDECMQETFGQAAVVIERNILARFYHKLGLNFSGRTDYAFSDFVDATKKSI